MALTDGSTARPAKVLRRDAAANRRKLVDAAHVEFAGRGLDVPLEEIARRAGVSIGTLYNHFPTRAALLDEVMPARLAPLIELGEQALACADPWQGFESYVLGTCERQAGDRSLNDILSRRYPDASLAESACGEGFAQVGAIVERARRAGALRADFTLVDFAYVLWSAARIIDATRAVAPHSWRRHLGFLLDGLRTAAATPIDEPPLTADQLRQSMVSLGQGEQKLGSRSASAGPGRR
ncbi:helix-turn-helix domain-containing protein [Fodinicola feengrottensis]